MCAVGYPRCVGPALRACFKARFRFPLVLLALACVALQGRGDSLSVRRFSLADGLSSLRVGRVVALPAAEGVARMVVQGEGGLSLFDGARFKALPYDRRKTLSVQSFFNTACFLDVRHGRLWLRDYYALSAYDVQSLQQLDVRALLGDEAMDLRNVFIDGEGDAWIQALNDTLYFQAMDGGGRVPVLAFSERNAEGLSPVVCAVVKVGGEYLVLVSTGELICLERGAEGFRESYRMGVCAAQTAYTVRGWAWDETTLLLATAKEFARFDTRTRSLSPFALGRRVNDVQPVPGGGMLVGTDDGCLVCYDSLWREVACCDVFEGASEEVAERRIMSLALDHEGGVWMGTGGDGVYYHSPQRPLVQFFPVGGGGVDVRSLCPRGDGGVLAATSAGVYSVAAGGGWARKEDLPSVPFVDIARDERGHLWAVSSAGHLCELDSAGQPLRVFTGETVEHLSGAAPFCLPTGDGRFLTCVRLNRLALFHPDSGRLEVLTERLPELLRFRNVVDACPMRGGFLVGTQNGLYYFEARGGDYRLDLLPELNDGLLSDKCTCLLRDGRGLIWIGTSSGLYSYDERSGRLVREAMTGEKGIYSLAEDGRGYLWASMSGGIVRVGGGEPFFLGEADGVGEDAGFMERSACLVDGAAMYFGAHGGVYRVEVSLPEAVPEAAPVAHILSVAVNDSLRPFDEGLRLGYRENTLSITLSALSYARPQHVVYRYRLRHGRGDAAGLWEEQRGEEGNVGVTYRMLAPGSYVFETQARLQGGAWGPMTALDVRISPPWWRRWWAWLCYALLVAAAGCYVAAHFVRLHNRRLDYARRLRAQRDREQLGEERMRFYTNITHELRTPLTLILGPLEDLCENPSMPAPLQERARRISDSAHRLLQLVNRLLEFRKTETGHRRLQPRALNLAVHCKEQFRHFAYMNRNSRLQYREEIDAQGMDLLVDPDAITTILSNLLANAVKFTPSGAITLSLHREGERVVMKVADTGMGIPADALPHLFEPYYQVEGSGQNGGTGIGLALVRQLVELHGGTLGVESQQGRGTTFTVALPARDAAATEVAPPSEAVDSGDLPSAGVGVDSGVTPSDEEEARALVLVVEDNADIRQYLVDSLGEDYRLLAAADGREGAELAMAEIPDIIIADVMMPEMDGIQMCRLLRGDVRTSHIPLILLTAKDALADKEAGYEAGADAYLTKPFTARMLKALLNNIRAGRRRLAERLSTAAASATPPAEVAEEGEEAKAPVLSTLDRRFIDELDALIADNIDNTALDMPFLCERLFMSRTTLYRKTKALLGHAPNEYIRKRRLQRAHEMLSSPEYANRTVTSIAYDCGFTSLGYFRSCFKAEFGISPAQMVR